MACVAHWKPAPCEELNGPGVAIRVGPQRLQAAALAVGLLEPGGAGLDDAVDEELGHAAAPALAALVAQARPALELVPGRVRLDVQRRDDAQAELAARLELAQLVERRGRSVHREHGRSGRPRPCACSTSARRCCRSARPSAAASRARRARRRAGSSSRHRSAGRRGRRSPALPSSARGPSMPAAASAAGVASAVWKSKNVSRTRARRPPRPRRAHRPARRRRTSRTRASGRAPTAPARSARARPPARRAPRPPSRGPRGRRRRVSSAPISGCWCASTSPGTSASPRPSMSRVRASHTARTAASSPTATIIPSRTRDRGRPRLGGVERPDARSEDGEVGGAAHDRERTVTIAAMATATSPWRAAPPSPSRRG